MNWFDIETLCKPIRDDAPCGEAKDFGDLELLNAFDAIMRDAAMARRLTKQKNEYDLQPREMRGEIPDAPNWEAISDASYAYISTKSKDCRILYLLIESMTRVHGYEGLETALRGAIELVTRFADHLHPKESENPYNALSVLSQWSKLEIALDAIRRVQVSDACPVCYQDKETSRYLAKLSSNDQAELQETGVLSEEIISRLTADCPERDAKSFKDQLALALDAASRFDELLREKTDKFGFATIRDELKSIQAWFVDVLPESAAAPVETDSSEADNTFDEASDVSATSQTGAVATRVKEAALTRDTALKEMQKLATFFRKTEPHSPVGYALEQAVRWARLPLPELLMEIVSDRASLSEVFKRTGIGPLDDSDD